MITVNSPVAHFFLDEKTIKRLRLKPADSFFISQFNYDHQIYEFAEMKNVFVMSHDLYGTAMSPGSCFIAFYGTRSFVGLEVDINTLKESTYKQVSDWIENNSHS